MPDYIDQTLEEMLGYDDQDVSSDLFVVDVMRRVQKERRTRKLILFLFGSVGALFGLLGALMLSDGISKLFIEILPANALMQLPLFAAGATAFYIWFMNDDLALNS